MSQGWTIALAIISGIATLFGILGISAFINERAKDHAKEVGDKINQKKLDKKTIEHNRRMKELTEAIKAEIKPLSEKIDTIDEKLNLVDEGTRSTLRNDILTCYYRCVEKGYRNDYDFQNMDHMYKNYRDLKGNSYVEDVFTRFKELPVKEEVKEVSISKPRKKKVLNENK